MVGITARGNPPPFAHSQEQYFPLLGKHMCARSVHQPSWDQLKGWLGHLCFCGCCWVVTVQPASPTFGFLIFIVWIQSQVLNDCFWGVQEDVVSFSPGWLIIDGQAIAPGSSPPSLPLLSFPLFSTWNSINLPHYFWTKPVLKICKIKFSVLFLQSPWQGVFLAQFPHEYCIIKGLIKMR